MKNRPKTFLLDVDGVLNDGSFKSGRLRKRN